MTTLDRIYATLAEQFLARFPEELSTQRTVGREAEYPVVMNDGQAADVQRLWPLLLERGDLKAKYDTGSTNLIVELSGHDYTYAIEVGRGTIELNSRPCNTILEAKAILEEATLRVVRAALRFGWMILGYGIQPITPPTLSLMTPKQRYQSLYRAMGNEWLWYTVTASDQTQIAIRRHEAIQMLNFGNLMTPVIIALCANSPVFGGNLSPFCSGREGHHELIRAMEHRHGMPIRPFRDVYDFVERICQTTYLIHRESGAVIPMSRPFYQYLLESYEREQQADFAAFLFHEHYMWNSARIRAAYGTIEIRPACQQPWHEHMAVMALNVGLIESADIIQEYLDQTLGEDAWQTMRTYQQQVIRHGLRAPQPAPQMLERIVCWAEEGLRKRGFGEDSLIQPIYERLYRNENPAQRARRVFRSDGMAGLLRHAVIRL
ncbi:MAG: glutamate-cysteine ligase family protein [Caldilineaceae bacterium]